MKHGIELRKAEKADLPLIQEFLKANDLCFEDIPDKKDSIVIARRNAQFIGVGGIERYGLYGLLRSVAIDRPFRGKGYGKELCDKLISRALSSGVKELYLLTTTAEAFFKRFGFERVDRKNAPPVIQETSEFRELCPSSSVLMWKRLEKTSSPTLPADSSGDFEPT